MGILLVQLLYNVSVCQEIHYEGLWKGLLVFGIGLSVFAKILLNRFTILLFFQWVLQ